MSSTRFPASISLAVLMLLAWNGPRAIGRSSQQQEDNNSVSYHKEIPYTLHVSAREVVVDIIAIDARNRPILDLGNGDLEVFDQVGRASNKPESILSLRIVDPSIPSTTNASPQTGFRISGTNSCLLQSIVHYQLAYSIQGSQIGSHTVLVRTKRRGVRLFFNRNYYAEDATLLENPQRGPETPGPVVWMPEWQMETTGLPSESASSRPMDQYESPSSSFGTINPDSHSLCGDVYELPVNTKRLPDFRILNSVGAIYANSLMVSAEAFAVASGIPGVTARTEWFGVDYYGKFWVSQPGTYEFQMISDDGAMLEIDGKRIIELDGIHRPISGHAQINLETGPHRIHLPYFQGPMTVTLKLWVKLPGQGMRIFDIRDFSAKPLGNITN